MTMELDVENGPKLAEVCTACGAWRHWKDGEILEWKRPALVEQLAAPGEILPEALALLALVRRRSTRSEDVADLFADVEKGASSFTTIAHLVVSGLALFEAEPAHDRVRLGLTPAGEELADEILAAVAAAKADA
jgi:hypothetical protein